MKKLNKIIMLPLFVLAMLIGITTVSQTKVYAYAYTTVYLEVGETYKQTTDNTEPIFTYASNLKGTGYDSKGVKVCDAVWNTATIKNRKYFTITAKNEGTATFYVNRLNSKKDADRVRTVKVRVFKKSVTPGLKNSISHSSADDDNFLNQQVYIYAGNSFKVTSSNGTVTPSDVSEDTAKKAVKTSLHIYECKEKGETLDKGTNRLDAGSLSGSTMTFSSKSGGRATTYVRASYKWTSSNGTVHYSPARIIKINIYPKPVMRVFKNNKAVDSMSMVLGNPEDVNTSVTNLQSGDILTEQECIVQDETKVNVKELDGSWSITPLSMTNGIPIRLTFSCIVSGQVSQHNGDAYAKISKAVSLSVSALKSVTVKGHSVNKKSVRIYWDGNPDAAAYRIYRSDSPNGAYEKIGDTAECFYDDNDDELIYNKTYYYKIRAVGRDEDTMSEFSQVHSVKLALSVPKIKSVTKSGKYYLIKIEGDKYSGYEVCEGESKKLLISTISDSVSIPLSSLKHVLYVRSFYKNDKTGAKAYSSYSNAYVINQNNKSGKIKIKTPQINKVSKSGKKITVKMCRKAGSYNGTGFQIVISTDKKFKRKKTIKTSYKTKTVTVKKSKATYYVKVRAFTKVNGKTKYGSYCKMKKIK